MPLAKRTSPDKREREIPANQIKPGFCKLGGPFSPFQKVSQDPNSGSIGCRWLHSPPMDYQCSFLIICLCHTTNYLSSFSQKGTQASKRKEKNLLGLRILEFINCMAGVGPALTSSSIYSHKKKRKKIKGFNYWRKGRRMET